MPTCFFHVRDGIPFIRDHGGVKRPDLTAAREQGHRVAETVLGGLIETPGLLLPGLFCDVRIDICDNAATRRKRSSFRSLSARHMDLSAHCLARLANCRLDRCAFVVAFEKRRDCQIF